MPITERQQGAGSAALSGRSHASARLLLDLARTHEVTEPERARSLVQQARALARAEGDHLGEAESLYRLASLAHYDGQPGDAFALAVEARDFAISHDLPLVLAWSLNLIGLVHTNSGNHSEALSCCMQALDYYRGTDHRVDEGNLLNTIATIHHELGDTDRAIVNYEAAITANAELNRPDFDAITLANVATLRAERGEYDEAIKIGERALDLCRRHAPGFLPEVLSSLAESYGKCSDFSNARVLLEAALAMLDASSVSFDDSVRSGVELAFGRVEMAAGEHATAIVHLDRALGLAEVIGAKPVVMSAHDALAESLKAVGDFEKAVFHLERKFKVNQQMFNEGTDIRIKTLQIAHEAEEARQQAEILRLRTSELEGLVVGRTTELEQFQLEALERLAILGEFRDTDTGEHTVRVGDMCAEIAHLLGQDPVWSERLRLAARLHDIGKVAIPDSILLKPGPLTSAEFEVMKTHTTLGARILSGSNSPLVQLAEQVALNHHERWDGTGYPNAIGGTEVPMSGRICAVADVFDALTSDRVYKKSWTVPDAVRYIARAAGTQFDPHVVEAFVRIAEERFGVRV
ncbi:MAG: tetratricopeptide repeat protein [Actinobacteria bacterium]|nr:tetratricopeptide repeat protein [Actinomycetota bacterium]